MLKLPKVWSCDVVGSERKAKTNKKNGCHENSDPRKNLDPLGVSVENSDPVISLIRDNKWYTTGAITDYVNDVLSSF